MKFKQEIIIFLLFVFLFFSISVVSATESLDDSSTDELVLLSTNNELVDTIDDNVDAVQGNDSADLQKTAETDESTNRQNQKKVLKASNIEEFPLKSAPELHMVDFLNNNPTYPQDFRTFIKAVNYVTDSGAHEGILYLDGLTFEPPTDTNNYYIELTGRTITVYGGSSESDSTFAVFDGKNKNTPGHTFYYFNFKNVIFKNIACNNGIAFIFRYCTLNNTHITDSIAYNNIFSSKWCTFDSCNFTNSKTTKTSLALDDVAFTTLYDGVMKNCNYINTSTQHHSGAICMNGHNELYNTNFTNCSSLVGGAIYIHGQTDSSQTLYTIIKNCTFNNCKANYEGGALGLSDKYVLVEDCTFINNIANKGSAIMVGGIKNVSVLSGNKEGSYNTICNCTFKNNTGDLEGGAVHITGNNNLFINCTFVNNTAKLGNGSAIYIIGENATINDTRVYNHTSLSGAIFIDGNSAKVINSTFKNNTGINGAGVYIKGSDGQIIYSNFTDNNVSDKGGAIYIDGSNSELIGNNFTANNAIPELDEHDNPVNSDDGLGGAIYVKGDHTVTKNNTFNHNTARNGSAIYTEGNTFQLTNDTFYQNQAYSYLLITTAVPEESYFNEKDINVTVVHVGGDNIINAIYNKAANDQIHFTNVHYTDSRHGNTTTGTTSVTPVKGANETHLYQDSREDYQNITLIITRQEDDEEIFNDTVITDIYGNFTKILPAGLKKGTYTVYAEHPEDWNYKKITNTAEFTINYSLTNNKTASNETPYYGSEIEYNLTITNDADAVYNDNGYEIKRIYEHDGGEYLCLMMIYV